MEKSYTVTVIENQEGEDGKGRCVTRLTQTFDTLDIGKLAAFLNSKPRKKRAKEKTTLL